MNALELKGQKFGNLYVIRRVENDKWGKAQFLTRCEIEGCGNEKIVSGYRLTHKKQPTTHCGCLTVKDLTGQRFGNLLIIDRAENDKWHQVCWNYICDCGKKEVVSGNRLTAKTYPMTHCGCLSSKHYSDSRKGLLHPNYKHGLSKTPEYYAKKRAKRRIKKRNNNAAFNLSYAESFAIPRLELDYCVYCGSTDNLSIDHIIPIDKGGTQDSKNLIRACRSCNSAKRNSFFIDWYLKTTRCKRSLDDIMKDMGFDSILHLQNYQDSMCPKHIEKDPDVRFHKLVKASSKNIDKLLDFLY